MRVQSSDCSTLIPISQNCNSNNVKIIREHSIPSKFISLIDHIGGVVGSIFKKTIPLSPWFLSRTVNLRICSVSLLVIYTCLPLHMMVAKYQNVLKYKKIFCTEDCDISVKSTLNAETKIDYNKIIVVVTAIASLIGVLDFTGILPQNIESRLTIDCLLLTTAVVGGGNALISGLRHLKKGYKYTAPKLEARTSYIAVGIVLTFMGISSLYSTVAEINQIATGLPIFYQLNAMQQEGVLKYRAIQTLNVPKTCNAVIIDGMSSKWGKFIDDVSLPSSELIYEHCNVNYYRVRSPYDFCNKIKQAANELGNINLLAINAHANSREMYLNKHYKLNSFSAEWKCIAGNLAEDAQIALMGCNTATHEGSLTELSSINVSQKREVSGFAAYYNPFNSLNSYKNGRFKFEGIFPIERTADNKIAFTTVFSGRSFVYGDQI